VMVSTLYSSQRTLERRASDQDSKHVPHEYKYSELTNAKSSYSERQKHQSAPQEHYLLDVRLHSFNVVYWLSEKKDISNVT